MLPRKCILKPGKIEKKASGILKEMDHLVKKMLEKGVVVELAVQEVCGRNSGGDGFFGEVS